MKYYRELSKLEDNIIRLDTVQSVLKIVADGVLSARREDVQHSLWFILDEVENINDKVSGHFYKLRQDIRSDIGFGTSEYLPPSQASTDLMNIVNSWVK